MKVIPLIPESEYAALDRLAEQQQLRQTIEAVHQSTQLSAVQRMEARSKEEVIQSYLIEMTAKNRAYYFILENGLLHQFQEFCTKK